MDLNAAEGHRPVPPAAWLVLAWAAYGMALLATAWIGDDAYITLRTIDNWLHGYGLRFNVAERVQVYTHPLWLLVLSGPYGLTGEPYFTTLVVSMNASLLAVGLLAWFGMPSRALGAGFLLLCLFSRAFMDYSTSGLENPLTHLLLALWILAAVHGGAGLRGPACAGLLGGLLIANRLDLALLILVPMIYVLATATWKGRLSMLAAATAPVVSWFGFATWYYGSPLPNTAWAKLGHGFDMPETVGQGIAYIQDSLAHDTLTLATVVLAVAIAVVRGNRLQQSLAAGALLYVLYTVWIGGDFMSGRFFSAPFFVSAWIVLQCDEDSESKVLGAVVAVAVATTAIHYPPPLLTGLRYGRDAGEVIHRHGIFDERAYYYPYTGLLPVRVSGATDRHPYAQQGQHLKDEGRDVAVLRAIGMRGFYAGPGLHIIDECALADPLLSRIPAMERAERRPGHFLRAIPSGYGEAIRRDANTLDSPALAAYYDAVRRVTRGGLFAPGRWSAMGTMLRGPDWAPGERETFVNQQPHVLP